MSADRSGFWGVDWNRPPWSDLLAEADLTIHVDLWHMSIDAFDPGAPWWQWREPCDCPDTSFGRNPHRWNCALTPIWAQTNREHFVASVAESARALTEIVVD